MKASDVMTVGAATIRSDASVPEAARLMLQYAISGLPVVDDAGHLVGIITEGDFLRRTETGTGRPHRPRWLEFLLGPGRLADEYVHSHSRKVEEVMTRQVVTVAEETPVEEIARLMERHRIKRVPVMRDDRVVGIVSRANLLRGLARQQTRRPLPPPMTWPFVSESWPNSTLRRGAAVPQSMSLCGTESCSFGVPWLMSGWRRHCALRPTTCRVSKA